MVAKAQGMEHSVRGEFSVLLSRPNKLSVLPEEEYNRIHIISDGNEIYIFDPFANEYTVKKAPDSLGSLLQDVAPFYAQTGGGPMVLFSFFSDDPYEEILKDVKSVKILEDKDLDGIPAYHLLFQQDGPEGSFDIHIWIEKERKLLLKSFFELSQSMGAGRGTKQTIRFEEEHRDIQIGVSLPATSFLFQPPEGSTEALSEDAALKWVGEIPPAFSLPSGDGKEISLKDYSGKIIMVDFWASWCPPCRKELPILQKIYDEYSEKDVVLIGINCDEDMRTGQGFVKDNNISFPMGYDTEGIVNQKYRVTAFPTLFIIGKSGKVERVHIGVPTDVENTLRLELDSLLEGKSLH